jgi:cell fate regulator YaaT (PSP1 superfamily)
MADIVQVALRGSRREFCLNSRNLWLQPGDAVIVQAEHGEAIGTVLLKDSERVELKRPGNVTREIIRKAEEEDLDQDDRNRRREEEAFAYCRERIEIRELEMDLADVEIGFNAHRITFYFSADHRVDFRELVRDLAARLQTRIELRQIGVRDQAKRLDGCGPCGRAFCCSTWLRDFHPVTLRMAREQQLSLNPGKISGACGRLMCCLAYEIAQYRSSAERLPPVGAHLKTGQGLCTVIRTEVYQEAVWIRDGEGGEHRIACADLPEEPHLGCGDCAKQGEKGVAVGPARADSTAGNGRAAGPRRARTRDSSPPRPEGT